MSFTLTRMLAYFTLFSYLVIGSVVVRVFLPKTTTITLSTQTLSLFSKTEIKSAEAEVVVAPEMKFADMKFPVEEKNIIKKAIVKAVVFPAPKLIVVPEVKLVTVEKNELPFAEPISLNPVYLNEKFEENLASLYKDFSYELVANTQIITEDTISTKLAQAEKPKIEDENDLTFFEYETEERANQVVNKEISTKSEVVHNVDNVDTVQNGTEEIAVNDLVAFDYSRAQADIKNEVIPVVGTVTTQNKISTNIVNGPVTTKNSTKPEVKPSSSNRRSQGMSSQKPLNEEANDNQEPDPHEGLIDEPGANGFMSSSHYASVTIQIAGTNLRKTVDEKGFEVRFNDDINGKEVIQDYNTGKIKLESDMASSRMTRSISLLKQGFAPTNTDLIMEEGGTEVSFPMIEANKFKNLLAPYNSRGALGMVLVELDDDVESASLDVPYSKVLHLDDNLRPTDSGEYQYQLFIGVKAGNAFLSYRGMNDEVLSKIIHVHDRELTFDAFVAEEVNEEKISLFEEDLLSKAKAPLIMSADQVRQFATEKSSKKVNDHTYKMNFGKTLTGTRRYLELNHQAEPVFVGLKDKTKAIVPSENFMRYILSRFEGSKLGNRCLVQVNLSKKASEVDVASESVDRAIETYTQVLDKDGRFYDSVSDNSRKIIVVGESAADPKLNQDGRINIKITYQDGSVEFLGSYCSPNSYLVEQL